MIGKKNCTRVDETRCVKRVYVSLSFFNTSPSLSFSREPRPSFAQFDKGRKRLSFIVY